MTTRMRVGVPVAADPENNTYGFFVLLPRYNTWASRLISTPTYSFGGFLWRCDVYPKGNSTGEGLGCRLTCLGPDSREGVVLPHWILRTLVDMVVVHPQKWEKLGVTPDDLSSTDSIISRTIDSDMKLPLAPRDYMRRANHVLKSSSGGQSVDYDMLCRFVLLQPSLFSDKDYNVVLYIRLVLHDSFNLNQLPYDPNAMSDDEDVLATDGDGDKTPKQMFLDALETRTTLIDKIANYDAKLSEATTETAKKALRSEIDKISKALQKLTPLQHYFIT